MSHSYSTDIVISGGGIGGLWLLNRLRNEGYQALLVETSALGSHQTIASQGIIHGGLKYALSGVLTGAANVTAKMPARWRDCINGQGEVDLQGVEILSEHYYMWSQASFRSKLKTFFGSKSLQGRVEAVPSEHYPAAFTTANVNGSLYRLPDFVINTSSLLRKLVSNYSEHIVQIDSANVEFDFSADGNAEAVHISHGTARATVSASRFVFAAGKGNEELIKTAGLTTAKTQRRPLKMVYVKKADLPPMYVHCIGENFSLTPVLTVTTHKSEQDGNTWYLGGELAENGVGLDNETQIANAKELLARQFPWIDTDGQWGILDVDRAEANINNNYRPDDAWFCSEHNVLAAWPTKLTLAPSLADKVVDYLQAENVAKSNARPDSLSALGFTLPTIATPQWEKP